MRGLPARRIRARGYLEEKGGPMLTVRSPMQLEILMRRRPAPARMRLDFAAEPAHFKKHAPKRPRRPCRRASRRLPVHGTGGPAARRAGRRRCAAHAERRGGSDRRAREPARRRRVWRRLFGPGAGGGGRARRLAPRRRVRRPLAALQDHDPEFAGRQCLRASRRLSLRDARADRAHRRIRRSLRP